MHSGNILHRVISYKRTLGFSVILLSVFFIHSPLTHATIGYYYQYTTCQGSCLPPTGVQIEGPYQAGNQNPPEQQACTNLGFARNYDAFEAPQRDAVDSVACYEYYDARGSIYDFDGAGQEKTIYYGTAAPPPAPTAALTANPTSVAYNGASALSWSSTNATSCTGSGFSTGGAVSGSVSSGALTSNRSYSVTCTGGGGSVTAYASVSVGQPPQADLTAGSVTPTSGFANQAINFNSSATNIGNATSGSFPLLFQIQNGAVFNSSYIGGLTQGATGYGSASQTLAAGTYQVRACANYNTSWQNVVSESDYSNNCGPWTTVTVTTPLNPDLTAGGVLPTTATAGQSVRLSGTTYNQGNGPASSYPDIFQIGSGGPAYHELNTNAGANPGGTNVSQLDYTFPSAGSYQVRLCANYNTSWQNVVSESDYSNNCGPWTTVTVAAPASPDLSAGGVSPSSATAGTAVTLSASIANTGTGSTNASFTDLFQRATDSSGSGAIDIGTYGNGVLNANSSNTASRSYTFSSAGTYYVRACADKSSAGSAGTIAESNEGNNCGPWTAITVAPASLPTPTCSFSASPSTVPSTLSWSSTNATSCTGGGFSTGGATSGSVGTSVAGAYTLSCTGSGGSCSASVNVGSQICTNPTGTITANPTRVKSGSASTITYSASGITASCTVSGPGVSVTIPANSCTVPNSSVSTGPLTTQSVYILTCDGVERGRVVVNVVPNIVEF